ncbi:MAG TPA: hypothetical protein VFR09_02140 [Alphaproteobacteria bacterium]|nr:hypothetical protein [Alphaproteobacteria bacterium]
MPADLSAAEKTAWGAAHPTNADHDGHAVALPNDQADKGLNTLELSAKGQPLQDTGRYGIHPSQPASDTTADPNMHHYTDLAGHENGHTLNGPLLSDQTPKHHHSGHNHHHRQHRRPTGPAAGK